MNRVVSDTLFKVWRAKIGPRDQKAPVTAPEHSAPITAVGERDISRRMRVRVDSTGAGARVRVMHTGIIEMAMIAASRVKGVGAVSSVTAINGRDGLILGDYQEARIKHLHNSIDKYIEAGEKA